LVHKLHLYVHIYDQFHILGDDGSTNL